MNRIKPTAVLIIGLLLSATVPVAAAPGRFANPTTTVFINEIHYDNTGTDAGEAIEIAGPAGTDLTGWNLVLYNGSNGLVYDTDPLAGVIADQNGGYGTIALSYPSNGIQNGSPDGVALVDPSSAVVQFLSYEGTLTALDGPASGLLSTDIGAAEAGTEPLGQSLQLTGTGLTYGDFTWSAPIGSTFGAVNTGQTFGTPPPTATPTETPTETPTGAPTETPTPTLEPPAAPPVLNEFSASTVGTDVEYVEIFGQAGTDYSAYTILEIEGDTTGSGIVDEVIAVGSTDAAGLWLGNLPANALENGTLSLLLVRDFTGALGADLDTNNDGVFDSTPWSFLADTVAVSDAGAGDLTYGSPTLGPNYDGLSTFAPGGASRIPDGFDTDAASDWVRNDFDLAGIPGFTGTPVTGEALNTPGAPNAIFVSPPIVMACASPLTTLEGFAASLDVSATDSDGTVIDILINSITPLPAAGSISLGNLVPAPGPGGTATATLTADAAVPAGSYAVQITATNNDPTPQTGTCMVTVQVTDVLTIGEVQGSVADSANGRTHRSPYAPPSGNGAGTTQVIVQGVIYEKTLARTSSGGSQHGFFLQNTSTTADSDPTTSDGVFVFMGSFTSLIGGYAPQVGDEVVIRARVTEFFSLTELTSASALMVVRSGVDLEAELSPFDAAPPDNFADAGRYWERREGMRARIVPGSVVLNGRNVFPSTMDGEVWLAHPDSEIAQRSGYERRSFRDPHPLDNDPALFDDGNGYRIILGSLGLKASAGDNNALIAPAGTFDEVSNAPVGGVYFSFSKYQIQIEQQLELEAGPDPAGNASPAAFDRGQAYSVATLNVENLYDFRDDPFDGCDFTGNGGCPGVSPPFDYVPASNAAYQARLGEIAAQIAGDLHAPDLILVQEAEDQDICISDAGGFTCGVANNADGRPDTLQELAARIASIGGPAYEAAYDRDGADDRGIVSAFLYRTDRVEILTPAAADPVLGSAPTVDYRGAALGYNTDVQNPKVLNADLPADVDLSTGVDGSNVFTRPAQVGLFRIWREAVGASVFIDVYALSNHFSSTPNARVGQRTEQALYNAAIVDALQAADPGALVIVGGDLNVYPRPDDPFTPGHPLYPSDQLGPLYDQGLVNLWDTLVAEVPSSAYSYVFEGQAQTLDQIFLTPSLMGELNTVRASHINSDWPADHDGDGPRGTSDHDPQVAVVGLEVSLEGLQALLEHFAEIGAITGNNTFANLMRHLEQAGEALAKGNQSQFESQLQAFASQVLDLSPQFVTPEAAEALAAEAERLASSE